MVKILFLEAFYIPCDINHSPIFIFKLSTNFKSYNDTVY